MKNLTALCGAALATLLLTGCNPTMPDTREADMKALKDNETQWNQDFVAKDAAKLLAHHADNAVLMSPGMPASSSKEAIRKTVADIASSETPPPSAK